MNGLMYVLHLLHLGGPASPKSRTGINPSSGFCSASGVTSSASGKPVMVSSSCVAGTLFSVILANLGDELPWSRATKSHVDGGGRCLSIVGYIIVSACSCACSLAAGIEGI